MDISAAGAGVSNEYQAKLATGANEQKEEVVNKLMESTEEVAEATSRAGFETGQKVNVSA